MEGFRARSAYKLIQIIEKYPELKRTLSLPGSKYIDLGAAPGSWCQVISKYADSNAKIIGLDLLPIDPIPSVKTYCCDFTTVNFKDTLLQEDQNNPFDIVFSDLCCNISGNSCLDNYKNYSMWLQVLQFSDIYLKKSGHFVIKVFESNELTKFMAEIKTKFGKTAIYKPKASRTESSEKFIVCLNKLKQPQQQQQM